MTDIKYRKITVYGIVQGVGFRPFVKRLADRLKIKGSVSNRGSYVLIYACGERDALDEFLELLEAEAPERAMIRDIKSRDFKERDFFKESGLGENELELQDFVIAASSYEAGTVEVSPDIAICDDCKKELFLNGDRRYHHPFINCTNCGPRLTILEAMPYDRERTVMKSFRMCPTCLRQYHDPEDRRFDAQPVCCPNCGPRLNIWAKDENTVWQEIEFKSDEEGEVVGYHAGTDEQAIDEAVSCISAGKIIAIKGIGGFHLSCDALNVDAINTLRQKKNRPSKPFAIMCKDFKTVKKYCHIDVSAYSGDSGRGSSRVEAEIRALMESPEAPILLLPKKKGALPEEIAPNLHTVGVMLPYAPIQLLLFDRLKTDVLVMTSGNRAGSPICRSEEEALDKLGDLCDLILTNDRDILIRADDSVAQIKYSDTSKSNVELAMIRRSRGFAPLPIIYDNGQTKKIDGSDKIVLSIGGELKNSFCVSKGDRHFLSPYVGDLSDAGTVEALEETIDRFLTLLECVPDEVRVDMHPDYQSTRLGKRIAKRYEIPVTEVQHHYAHVLSVMAENDIHEPVIGVAYDGTGYGLDGTVWGSEIMIADTRQFKRAGHIKPFTLIGGDVASKDAWRSAVSVLLSYCGEKKARAVVMENKICSDKEFDALLAMKNNNFNCITSTSMGRYFDGMSAVVGACRQSTYEGEAAVKLQMEAENHKGDKNSLAYRFHEMIADSLAMSVVKVREKTGISKVVLSGGCFVNTLLTEMAIDRLKKFEFEVFTHSLVPCNDGGIALGQAIYHAPVTFNTDKLQ